MLGNLLGVVVNVVFLTYVKKLEKEGCVCSDSKFRDYIKYFSGAMIGLFVLSLVLSILSIKVKVPKVLMLLLSLVIFRSRRLPSLCLIQIFTQIDIFKTRVCLL